MLENLRAQRTIMTIEGTETETLAWRAVHLASFYLLSASGFRLALLQNARAIHLTALSFKTCTAACFAQRTRVAKVKTD